MEDLDKFLQDNEGQLSRRRTSILDPFTAEILRMKELGYTEKVILQFLEQMKNVKVSQQTLNWFIRSRAVSQPTTGHQARKNEPAHAAGADASPAQSKSDNRTWKGKNFDVDHHV